MRGRQCCVGLMATAACLVPTSSLTGQDISGRLVVYGRTEDAVTRKPIEGVRITAADSAVSVLTDSLGVFAIPLPREGPHAVYAEQFGYRAEQFDLELGGSPHTFVLLLDPRPLEIEGLTVVEEAALTAFTRSLEQRRNFHPGFTVAIDRAELERFSSASLLELVRARWPGLSPCASDGAQLCIRLRSRTLSNRSSESRIAVCVDEWRSFSPATELDALAVRSVALVEIYRYSVGSLAPPQVRVYTVPWTVSQAGNGRTTVRPLVMGC